MDQIIASLEQLKITYPARVSSMPAQSPEVTKKDLLNILRQLWRQNKQLNSENIQLKNELRNLRNVIAGLDHTKIPEWIT